MSDLVIEGGLVVDGTGAPPSRADVAVEGGRIAAVGAGLSAEQTIDAGGMLVAPGFIDIHTHDDFTLPLRPEAEAKLRQGVTTTVTGNCGFSPFPLTDCVASRTHGAFFEPELRERWKDLAEFAGELGSIAPAINVVPLVGFGAVRLAVIGEEDRGPRDSELTAMRSLVRTAMRQGARGGSSGLVYAPGCYAATAELIALAEEVAAAGGFYATHMRDEASRVEEAVAEAIAIGNCAGCPVHISHHKAIGRANWGKVNRTLGMVDAARDGGQDVSLDAYPYVAGSSTLLSVVPAGEQVGGVAELRRRIADPAARARIAAGVRREDVFAMADIVLADVPSDRGLEGLPLPEAAERRGQAPEELTLDLIGADGEKVVMIGFGMDQDDVDAVLTHPATVVGSDGWVQAVDAAAKSHPRNFSTTVRFLSEYVRDRSLIGLPSAIRKLTSGPADRLGLRDRGRLVAGAVADVVVLDYERMRDLATFAAPSAYPDGIEHVLVGGAATIESGDLTDARTGSVLLRGGD